jgi:hypothetical protein
VNNQFNDSIYREISSEQSNSKSNVLKSGTAQLVGKTKISIDEENHEGVKIIIKKDANENVKEIKFVCSCGQTKSIILDYSE